MKWLVEVESWELRVACERGQTSAPARLRPALAVATRPASARMIERVQTSVQPLGTVPTGRWILRCRGRLHGSAHDDDCRDRVGLLGGMASVSRCATPRSDGDGKDSHRDKGNEPSSHYDGHKAR